MEKVIDRTAYRRNISMNSSAKKKNIECNQKKIKKFLYQLLVCTLIFLGLSIAKLYKVESVLMWVNMNLKSEMDFEEIYKYGQNKIIELKEFLKSIESNENIVEIEQTNDIDENIEEIKSDIENNIENLFKGSGSYINVPNNFFDCLIVDEAHGALYNFSDKLPKTAISQGADISINSLHKTAGALNQTALLNINKDIRNIEKVKFFEEIGVKISVGDLKWVGELFFPWGKKSCHQICLYYVVELQAGDIM